MTTNVTSPAEPAVSATSAPSPYFGVDAHAPGLLQSIEAAVLAHAPKPGQGVHYIHALIDGAVNPGFGEELLAASRRSDSGVRAVYDGTPLSSAGSHGIFLWNLRREALPELLARCSGRPMLSVIQTPLEVDAIRHHLQGFIRARTEDGMTFVLRLADPIVLHELLLALGPEMQTQLRAGFAAWHVIGRDGCLSTWAGTAATATLPPARSEPWPLTDEAFGRLVDSGEIDQMLCEAVTNKAALYRPGASEELYACVQALLQVMDRNGVDDAAMRREWVDLALSQGRREAAVQWLEEQMWRKET